MGLGKFKTVISLDGYRLSFMPFVPASRLKEELNDEQRKKYPWIDWSLKLSMLRSLKERVIELFRDDIL